MRLQSVGLRIRHDRTTFLTFPFAMHDMLAGTRGGEGAEPDGSRERFAGTRERAENRISHAEAPMYSRSREPMNSV